MGRSHRYPIKEQYDLVDDSSSMKYIELRSERGCLTHGTYHPCSEGERFIATPSHMSRTQSLHLNQTET